MKKSIRLFCVLVLMASGFSSYSQKSQSVSDTVKSGKELVSLKSDIASLTSQLAAVNSNLLDYKSGISKETGIKPFKLPYETASQSENHALNDLHSKIFIIASEISKKQQRLQEINPISVL